jgi:hypothetical protein
MQYSSPTARGTVSQLIVMAIRSDSTNRSSEAATKKGTIELGSVWVTCGKYNQ